MDEHLRCLDWEMWEVLPKGSPYRELVLDEEGDNGSELLLAVASMDLEELMVNAAVAAGARWEDGPEDEEDADRLERALTLFAASDVSAVREAVGHIHGLPVNAFAALSYGSRRVRDNALAYVAMQPDVEDGCLRSIALNGNEWAKDEVIRHPNVSEDTIAVVAQGDGPVADNARRELARRRGE